MRTEKQVLGDLGDLLHCRIDELKHRVSGLLDEKKDLERKFKNAKKGSFSSVLDSIFQKSRQLEDIQIVAQPVEVSGIDELRTLGDCLRERLKHGVGVLGTIQGDKLNFLCVVTDDLIKKRGLKAGDIVREVAGIAGGTGGGKPHLALAGGKDVAKCQDALDEVITIVKNLLS